MGSRGKCSRRGIPSAMTGVCYGLLPCDRAPPAAVARRRGSPSASQHFGPVTPGVHRTPRVLVGTLWPNILTLILVSFDL